MAGDNLGTLTVDLIANTGGFERGMNQAERALKRTAKEAKYQGDQLEQLVGKIDPVTGAYGRLDKMESQLRAHRKAGRIDEPDFQDYLGKIEAQRLALGGTDKAQLAAGKSAKELAFATRNLPAQFTDIAVSLQAGQNPLTVFLQQGGQLKDMFGGAGPAARALGGYVVGLVNPFTAAAAAAAVLALAYKQGSDEGTRFATALITTGDAAGTTSGQLADMATAIDAVAGTHANAAEALALITETGKFTADQIAEIGLAAVVFEQETGQAVSKTIDQFKRLAEEPAKASAALNEQYNYLTASVYAQIAALEAQGDAAGAAELAINTYAEAMRTRADQINGNLGVIERAWRGITSGAAEAWDTMLGIGREQTIADQLAAVDAKMKQGVSGRARGLGIQDKDNANELLQLERDRLLGLQDMERERAKAAGEDAKNNKASIKAQEELNKALMAGRTNAQKLQDEYKLIEKRVSAAALTGVIYSDAQVQQLRDAAAKQYTDPVKKTKKAAAAPAYRDDAGTKLLATLREQYATLSAQSTETEKLGTAARALIGWQQQLADIKSKQVLTADQKSLLANEDLLTAQYKRNAAVEAEVTARKDAAAALKDYDALTKSLLDKEDKQLALTRERFAILDKARAAGLGDAEFNKTNEAIARASETPAPTFAGIDPTVGGVVGEIAKLDEAQAELEAWYEQQLAMLEENRAARADLNDVWNEEELARKQEFEDKMGQIEYARQSAGLKAAQEIFGNMATLAQSENKKLAAIGKAAAVASATIDGFVAVQKALAAFPPPFNFIAAAAVGVATTANVANIMGVGFETGGYTGNGGTSEVAGVVHGKEFVFDAKTTQRLGVSNLQALQSGKSIASVSGGGDTSVTQVFNVTGQVDNRTASQMASEAAQKQQMVRARFG